MSDYLTVGGVALEVECPNCKGTGTLEFFGCHSVSSKKCRHCDGNGSVLSEDGEALVEFVKRHLKLETRAR